MKIHSNYKWELNNKIAVLNDVTGTKKFTIKQLEDKIQRIKNNRAVYEYEIYLFLLAKYNAGLELFRE